MKIKNNNGFSLIEILAAIGIIGIIAFLAIPNIIAIKQEQERNSEAKKIEEFRKTKPYKLGIYFEEMEKIGTMERSGVMSPEEAAAARNRSLEKYSKKE